MLIIMRLSINDETKEKKRMLKDSYFCLTVTRDFSSLRLNLSIFEL